MTITEIEKELKQNILNGIYLLYGDETYLLETNLKKMKKIFGELLLGINYIQIDETNINELIANLETPAFGFEKKLVIVKNTGLLKKEGKKVNQQMVELREKIINYMTNNLNDIINFNIIIFVQEEVDKNKLYKFIEKNGKVCLFEKQKPIQIQARLKSIYNAYKVNIEDSTLMYLIENCGTGMQELINESRKLIEFVGENGTVKKADIDLMCIKQTEAVIFELTDSLSKRDIRKSLEILNTLLYNKEPIQKIFITLYNHFKKLYIVKLAVMENKDIVQVLDLKPNQLFLVGKYKTQANAFSKQELKEILNELILLDQNYKIGLIDINIGLEAILAKYCGK